MCAFTKFPKAAKIANISLGDLDILPQAFRNQVTMQTFAKLAKVTKIANIPLGDLDFPS